MTAARMVAMGEVLAEFTRPCGGPPLDVAGPFEGPFIGGAPTIFAGACMRLGVPTTLLATVGDDAFGRLIRRQAMRDGLDLTYVVIDPARPTGCAFVAYAADGRRDFIFHLRDAAAGTVDPAWPPPVVLTTAHWLHVCGSTLTLSRAWEDVILNAVRMAKTHGAHISFDPNLRPELLTERSASEVYAPVLRLADIVLPSGDEAIMLTGERTPEEGCQRLLKEGADLVILKRGAQGATAFTRDQQYDAAPFPVTEVDPTGAGDVFAAALACALLVGRTVPVALRHACAAGALAVTRRGGLDGAPTQAELDAFLSAGALGT